MFRFDSRYTDIIKMKGSVKVIPRMTKDEVVKILRTDFKMPYNQAVRIVNEPEVLATFLEVEIVDDPQSDTAA